MPGEWADSITKLLPCQYFLSAKLRASRTSKIHLGFRLEAGRPCRYQSNQLKELQPEMKKSNTNSHGNDSLKQRHQHEKMPSTLPVYPFAAIVGQEEMKLALILNVINPSIGGAVIMGQRGTGKSTAVRALVELLPRISVVRGCPYRCDPAGESDLCAACSVKLSAGSKLQREHTPVAVVDLPLGATEDRVCGTIDIESALREGAKTFEPGLLAKANRGFLYIDEVNLLEDHLVDLLLDVAVTGRNKVERESMSVEHPARFVLIGSGNPEEGELRPQLLDRFGLHVEVETENELEGRVEIVERREAFDHDPGSFSGRFDKEQLELRKRITRAQKSVAAVTVSRPLLRKIAELCTELRIDGHRGELTITRAARALAALEGRKSVTGTDAKRVAGMALRHRLRRDPLEETATTERIQQALDRIFDVEETKRGRGNEGSSGDDGVTSLSEQEGSAATGAHARRQSADPAGMNGADALKVNPAPTFEMTSVTGIEPKQRTYAERERSSATQRKQRSAGKNDIASNSERGRYVRSTAAHAHGARLAVDATLRAAATFGHRVPTAQSRSLSATEARPIPSQALRFKELRQKSGRLFIFAIDTSGSMALNRISHAKGAVLNLLRQSYIRRDSVAIIGFRGKVAEVLLPPSRSMLRARRALDSMGVGGSTPLSSGLACSLEMARRVKQTYGEIVLALFTDGGGNIALSANSNGDRVRRRRVIENEVARLGAELKKAKVSSIVVDSQNIYNSNRDTLALAEQLGAQFVRLQPADDRPVF